MKKIIPVRERAIASSSQSVLTLKKKMFNFSLRHNQRVCTYTWQCGADAGNGRGIVDVVWASRHLGRPGDRGGARSVCLSCSFFLECLCYLLTYVYGLSNAASLKLTATFMKTSCVSHFHQSPQCMSKHGVHIRFLCLHLTFK